MKVTMDNCCLGCCTVQQGTKVLGILSFINAIIGLATLSTLINEVTNGTNNSHVQVLLTFPMSLLMSFLVGQIIYVILMVIISILLLAGIKYENVDYVYPYVAVAVAGTVWRFAAISGVFVGICKYRGLSGWTNFFIFLGLFMIIALDIYITRVVYSYYIQLRNKKSSVPKIVMGPIFADVA